MIKSGVSSIKSYIVVILIDFWRTGGNLGKSLLLSCILCKIYEYGDVHVMLSGVQEISLRPKLKFYLFPLTSPTLKKRPYPKNLLQFSVKNFFFLDSFANFENCPM